MVQPDEGLSTDREDPADDASWGEGETTDMAVTRPTPDHNSGTGRGGGGRRGGRSTTDGDKLRAMAWAIHQSRIRRAREFGPDLFVDPAWDMLTVLFARTHPGEAMRLDQLCRTIEVPVASGTRWADVLAERGHVSRSADPDDPRQILVRLTPDGMAAMRRVLGNNMRTIEALTNTRRRPPSSRT